MDYQIISTPFSIELKQQIYAGFSKAAIAATGIDGLAEEPKSFSITDNGTLIGSVVVQMFWGQLHIKYLYVGEGFRRQGIGRRLMEHALAYGKKRECSFAFVETMSFQAPDFYQKFGFKIELVRDGYDKGTSFYYMKKDICKR